MVEENSIAHHVCLQYYSTNYYSNLSYQVLCKFILLIVMFILPENYTVLYYAYHFVHIICISYYA